MNKHGNPNSLKSFKIPFHIRIYRRRKIVTFLYFQRIFPIQIPISIGLIKYLYTLKNILVHLPLSAPTTLFPQIWKNRSLDCPKAFYTKRKFDGKRYQFFRYSWNRKYTNTRNTVKISLRTLKYSVRSIKTDDYLWQYRVTILYLETNIAVYRVLT